MHLGSSGVGLPEGVTLTFASYYFPILHQTGIPNIIFKFLDNTDIRLSNSIKKLNKLVNADLKLLANWLNANKISLNVKKLK